jgi:ribosomal-protein-alanine N-acetyltransferase
VRRRPAGSGARRGGTRRSGPSGAAAGRRLAASPAFRELRRTDLDALAGLERRIFPNPWAPGAFEAFLGDASAFSRVALAGGRVVGYALGWCAAGEAELMNLAVAPGWRRRSLGRDLLAWAMGHCARRGARRMFLEVRASNETAKRLYERCGFQPAGRRRAYYANPREDALVLVAELAGARRGPGASPLD